MTRANWQTLRHERLATPDARKGYAQAERAYAIGRDVRHMRESQRLSQRELGDLMGTTQSVVARLEAGGVEPSIKTLDRVAAALGVVLDITFRSAA